MRGQRCGDCYYWEVDNVHRIAFSPRHPRGTCQYEVIFPDSTYSRSEGFRRKMDSDQGPNCPAWMGKNETFDSETAQYYANIKG